MRDPVREAIKYLNSSMTSFNLNMNIEDLDIKNVSAAAAVHRAEWDVKDAIVQTMIVNTLDDAKREELITCLNTMKNQWEKHHITKFSMKLAHANLVAARKNQDPLNPPNSCINWG